MKASSVNLHFEKLAIGGRSDLNGHHIGAAVESKFNRLLGSQDLTGSPMLPASIKAIEGKPILKVSSERCLGLKIADLDCSGIKV